MPVNKPTQLLVLLILTGFFTSAGAIEILVGERSIEIPVPGGYVELSPDMTPYYEAMWAYKAPGNHRYLILIRETKADAILRGETVDVGRYMNVETEIGISQVSVSDSQFKEIQDLLRNQLSEMVAAVEEHIPEITEAGNATLSEQLGADFAVELGGVVPLPVHLDTDDAIASSMYMTVGASVDGESVGNQVMAATMLTLRVRDKVIFLYVYGSEPDLDWTRETAARWAEDIVAANPLSEEDQHARKQPGTGLVNWDNIFKGAGIAAVIGALIALFGLLLRRKR